MHRLRRGRGASPRWLGRPVLAVLAAGLLQGAAAQPQADDERARKLANGTCALCHGAQGESSTDLYPRLAGQHAGYIARQLADFKSGQRRNKSMQDTAARLSPEEMAALGRYFERQEPVREPAVDSPQLQLGRAVYEAGLPARGVQACASCHGPDGVGTIELPRLAGQRPVYALRQLRAFRDGSRRSGTGAMNAIAAQLEPAEMEAVAAYLATR